MREIFENEEELIKQAQQVILEKTSVLDEETRSKVYSKLQSIKFYQIDMEEARQFGVSCSTAAFFLNSTNAVYLIEGKNAIPKLSVITHELLHGVSTEGHINGFFFGLMYGVDALSQTYYKNNAITEGFTEYLTCKFLNHEQTTTAYFDFVNIAKFIFDSIGEENAMKFYFNSDLDGLKQSIRETFHLRDNYLIDKLFYNMDKRNDDIDKIERIFDSPFIRRCQEILIEMQMNKVWFEHKNEIKNFNEIFNYIDLGEFFKYINAGISMHYNKKLTYDKKVMLSDFLKTGDYNDTPIEIYDLITKIFIVKDNEYMKNISPKHVIMMTDLLNSTFSYTLTNGQTPLNFKVNLFRAVLGKYRDEKGKINLSYFSESEKYDFMTNILYNSLGEKCFELFYPKDLVWYTNHNNLARYKKLYSASFVAYVYDQFEEMTGNVPDQYKKVYSELKKAKEEMMANSENKDNTENDNTQKEKNEKTISENEPAKIV